jgi:hypothetical protein
VQVDIAKPRSIATERSSRRERKIKSRRMKISITAGNAKTKGVLRKFFSRASQSRVLARPLHARHPFAGSRRVEEGRVESLPSAA